MIAQVARCRIMVTGSYHAAVFALSMGIPAISVTGSSHYRHKLVGVTAMFDAHPEDRVLSLADPDLGSKLFEAMRQAWETADDDRPSLLEAAASQIARGRTAYERIFSHVDSVLLSDRLERTVSISPTRASMARVLTEDDGLALCEVLRGFSIERQSMSDSVNRLVSDLEMKESVIGRLADSTNENLAAAQQRL